MIGVVAVVIGLLVYYWQREEERLDLRVQINSVENLIELKEQIDDLMIMYKGRDITNREEQIKIVNFTIFNQGNDVLQQYYDRNDTFGIKFYDCEIIAFKLSETNSDYVVGNIKPRINNVAEVEDSKIGILELRKIIIERDERIMLKVYFLQRGELIRPKLEVIGKIAGIKKIPIAYSFEQAKTYKGKKWLFLVLGLCVVSLLFVGYSIWFGTVVRRTPSVEEIKRIAEMYSMFSERLGEDLRREEKKTAG